VRSEAEGVAVVRSKPGGTFVLVHPDGREEPYTPPPTDWARIDAMTDEDIARQIAENPDAAPELTDDEWDRAIAGTRVRRIREKTGLSQPAFAERYRIPVGSLRDWEQGRRMPDSATLAYLTVIEREREAVERALRTA
jgi:putative transcriptional regulator